MNINDLKVGDIITIETRTDTVYAEMISICKVCCELKLVKDTRTIKAGYIWNISLILLQNSAYSKCFNSSDYLPNRLLDMINIITI